MAILCAVGCDSAPTTVANAPASSAAEPAATNPELGRPQTAESEAVLLQTSAPEPKNSASKESFEKTADSEAAYTPPFPDRGDLFVPPTRTGKVAKSQEESGDAVELMGFVTLDHAHAVLSIGGVTAPLRAGDEKFGVSVISVSPPKAVLQRGGIRWTATLQ